MTGVETGWNQWNQCGPFLRLGVQLFGVRCGQSHDVALSLVGLLVDFCSPT